MCTPSTLPVSLLKRHLALPLPSSSASALELALKDPTDLPRVKPSFSARSLACSSVSPTMAISGCVKQAAGIASWSTSCDLPQMFSTAEMPWADAACASIILPLASPMHHRPGTTAPSALSSTCILSLTCTNPRTVSMFCLSSSRPWVLGTRPVHVQGGVGDLLLGLGINELDLDGLLAELAGRHLRGEHRGVAVDLARLDEHAVRHTADLRVEGRHQRIHGLDEGHLRAERRVDVGEFQPDVPRADDGDPVGHRLQLERVVRGEDRLAIDLLRQS